MLIVHDLNFCSESPTVTALGFFDGVHKGHRAVIAEARAQAHARGAKCAVFTFEPPHHTDRAVSKSNIRLLQSAEQRYRLMEELGVELVFCPPFESFYNLTPEEFVTEILCNTLRCRGVVCGEDYRFGKKGAGNAALLRELAEPCGITVTALARGTGEGGTVSSSRIRRCLAEGDVALAGRLLEAPYAQSGFPERQGDTLCLRLPPEMMPPCEGTYRGRVQYPDGESGELTVEAAEGCLRWQAPAGERAGQPVTLTLLDRR